jgi:hypothetical protein
MALPLFIRIDVHTILVFEHVHIEDDAGLAVEAFANHPAKWYACPATSISHCSKTLIKFTTYKLCLV